MTDFAKLFGEIFLSLIDRRGSRDQITGLLHLNKDNLSTLKQLAENELADGSVSECLVKISRAYLNYMVNNGDISLIHNQNTYLFYYGYVIGDYYSLNEKYEDAIVICDITTGDKRDLYTALLSISNNATIYYNLDKKIIY